MSHEEFDKLVQAVEGGIGRDHEALRRRVAWLALAGFAGLLSSLAIVVFVAMAFIIPGIIWFKDAFMLVIIGSFVLVLGGWAVIRVLWVRVPPPEGRPVSRAEALALFALLDQLRAALRSAPFHLVLVVPECNAAVVQSPRLGVFGWHKNYLLLGLPLLENFSKDELHAVLAHEFAHLSRQHGRSSQWIYRLRRSWELLFQRLSRPRVQGEISLRPLIRKFIDWFWPRFNAHAFVLSRAQEYQADAVSAELTSPTNAAQALTRVAFYGRALDQKFWPDFWQHTKENSSAPEGVFLRLNQALETLPDQGMKWLEQAFHTTTTNADTHPCLSDRLRAIGYPPDQTGPDNFLNHIRPPRPSAAEVLLGDALPKIRAEVEKAWRKNTAEAWSQQHNKAGPLHDRLGKIEQITAAKTGDTDALWDQARVVMELQGKEASAPLLEQILVLDPKHVQANFHLGSLLLKSGQPRGEQFIEKALGENEELLPEAADQLHAFFRQSGQSGRIRELYARLDRHEKTMVESRRERSQLTSSDTLIPHELSAGELKALLETLAADPDLVAAHLGRKNLLHLAHQRLFLLCIHVRPAWHRLPGGDREQTAVNRMFKAIRLPGRVMVFAPTGSYRAIARKLRQVPGAEVFKK